MLKSFPRYFLIGITLMLILIVAVGFLKEKNVIITAKTLVLNSKPNLVYKSLTTPEECKAWSSLFKSNKDLDFKFDSNKIHWKMKDSEKWSTLTITETEQPTALKYEIAINGNKHNVMEWKLVSAGMDTELECTFKLELPWFFRLFKESFEVKMTKNLEKNIDDFKTYFETKPFQIEEV